MATLEEHIIVAGAENHPLMLEKSTYDSWASRIRLFIKGKKNGRMMLDSIDNGSLVYPTIEEDGQTRPKKYSKLTEAQQLQDDYDVQATNIILYGLPPDMYALVNHQEVVKDIWDKVKLQMKGTKLSYQEREFILYNLFDKFASIQDETLYEYYWRFSQPINDMNTIRMKMQQVQVNTKFLNALPPEWSKFVTDVKYPDPLALVANSQTLYNPAQSPQHSVPSMHPPPQKFTLVYAASSHHQHHHTPVNPLQQSVSPQPYISSSMTQQSQAEFPQLDSGLAVHVFQQEEDPIDCINKAMTFLSVVASSSTSSRKTNSEFCWHWKPTTSRGNSATSQPRVVKCYNYHGEGHMARQCTQLKRPRNSAWFKEKLMLVEAQEAGQILDEEQLAFIADPGIAEAPVAHRTLP
ncbi:hypothetical protein Tco_0105301 [Tanacetum coccineum]